MGVRRGESIAENFWDNVTIGGVGDCWEWLRYTNVDGYGRLRWNEKYIGAHRVAWEKANGPIPGGMHVLHRCDNPPCVNPSHLFLGTNKDNMDDRDSKGRLNNKAGIAGAAAKKRAITHCPKGHLYDGENTYVNKRGQRSCRLCRHEWVKENRMRKKENACYA
jgi:hypothetical protein